MKETITYEEQQLMSLYNTQGTRNGLIQTLTEMRIFLDKDEQELKDLTDCAIMKLQRMTDAEFEQLDLIPDFTEDMDGI